MGKITLKLFSLSGKKVIFVLCTNVCDMITFFERENLKYAMIGSGSWATALVKLLLNHQQSISWFMRSQKNIDNIRENHHSRSYLQSVLLDPTRLNMST